MEVMLVCEGEGVVRNKSHCFGSLDYGDNLIFNFQNVIIVTIR